MNTIREVFTQTRSLHRPIERVIDYAATDEERLHREISEYEVTESVERALRRFLEAFDAGVRTGDVTEIGVWVAGFYGSGKSSFTKYLGLALDPTRTIKGAPFVDRLADRIEDKPTRQLLKTVASRHATAVFMIDLGTDALVESALSPVTNVLYWNVLRALGFSKVTKVADLEIRLERDGQRERFYQEYEKRFPGRGHWNEIHDDPKLAVHRAAELAPTFYPEEFPRPEIFRTLQYQLSETITDHVKTILDLVRRVTGHKNIVFFVDEVGQYVAPRKELILNLDGLARAFKEQGKGRVWFVATAQQTLTEISERASLNSTELFKLKDRFPIAIELEATDIREITARRLLTKNDEGESTLKRLFGASGELLRMNTHLTGWPDSQRSLDADVFAQLYPFLPERFDLVLALIRALARRTGGTGLRSAIRVVQDLLVDASHALPPGTVPVADRPLGRLVAIDDLYDTLRQDIRKDHPQAVEGVERVTRDVAFKDDPLALRAAKAVAALQPLENRPRTVENIAALLHADVGAPGSVEAVRDALQRLVDARRFGLVELRADSGSTDGAGFLFLSDEVQPIQRKRDEHTPTQSELDAARWRALGALFDPVPKAQLEGVKTVQAKVMQGRHTVAGETGEVTFLLHEETDAGSMEQRLATLVTESQARDEHRDRVLWLFARPPETDEHLLNVCRSEFINTPTTRAQDKDRGVSADVSRYLRSEERRAERAKEATRAALQQALLGGWFVFRGIKRPVRELGGTMLAASAVYLAEAASKVFHQFALVKKNVAAEAAARFLNADHPGSTSRETDPLGLRQQRGGRPLVDKNHPALQEALRAFRDMVRASGAGRVQGAAVLDYFNSPPYGWTKDTTRYLFAALLVAGEVELHAADGVLRTAGPKAAEAVRSTQSFNRVGVALRGDAVPLEALDRASRRLEEMFGVEVLPLEDQVSRAVRAHFPTVMESAGSLPDRLRLLGLPGEDRARRFLQTCADLLKEDAGGAAGILGTVESTVPPDKKWAEALVKALDKGGEHELRAARDLLARLHELGALFPTAAALSTLPALATLHEVLASESFHERMTDLREACRQITAAIVALDKAERQRHAEALARLRDKAETGFRKELAWDRVSTDERQSIQDSLDALEAPESPGDPLAGLQRLLTRRLALGELAPRLQARIDAILAEEARAKAEKQKAQHAEARDGAHVEEVIVAEMVTEATLRSVEDVEGWIDELRARLLYRVERSAIRVRGAR
jgi:hypothetical protein